MWDLIDEDFDTMEEHDKICDEVSVVLGTALDRTDISEFEIEELINMCEDNMIFMMEEEEK